MVFFIVNVLNNYISYFFIVNEIFSFLYFEFWGDFFFFWFLDRFLCFFILLKMMRFFYKCLIMVIFLFGLIFFVYVVDDDNISWVQKFLDVIKVRDLMIFNINVFVGGINDQSIKDLIIILEIFFFQFEGLDNFILIFEE